MVEIILDTSKMTREQAIEDVMHVLGITRARAELYVAITRKELPGDEIEICSKEEIVREKS